MNMLPKGAIMVVISTVIASSLILSTGQSVAESNQAVRETSSVKSQMAALRNEDVNNSETITQAVPPQDTKTSLTTVAKKLSANNAIDAKAILPPPGPFLYADKVVSESDTTTIATASNEDNAKRPVSVTSEDVSLVENNDTEVVISNGAPVKPQALEKELKQPLPPKLTLLQPSMPSMAINKPSNPSVVALKKPTMPEELNVSKVAPVMTPATPKKLSQPTLRAKVGAIAPKPSQPVWMQKIPQFQLMPNQMPPMPINRMVQPSMPTMPYPQHSGQVINRQRYIYMPLPVLQQKYSMPQAPVFGGYYPQAPTYGMPPMPPQFNGVMRRPMPPMNQPTAPRQ